MIKRLFKSQFNPDNIRANSKSTTTIRDTKTKRAITK